jgi:hypothetical protein
MSAGAPRYADFQRRLDLAPPRSKRCTATLALACLVGWLGVNEQGMFEKPRWIAVSIRCCEREGRCRDCEDR